MHLFQRFKMWLYKKLTKSIDLYKSIDDLPIYNFHKVMLSDDFRFLVKHKISDKQYAFYIDKLGEKWVSHYDEYLDHFGLSKAHSKIIDQQTKIAKLIIKRWEREDKSLESVIEIEQMRLKELSGKREKKSTFEEDIAVIEKYRGIGMDAKKTSVKMFYTYIKIMEKDGKENQRV